jgi:hypothetical protein
MGSDQHSGSEDINIVNLVLIFWSYSLADKPINTKSMSKYKPTWSKFAGCAVSTLILRTIIKDLPVVTMLPMAYYAASNNYYKAQADEGIKMSSQFVSHSCITGYYMCTLASHIAGRCSYEPFAKTMEGVGADCLAMAIAFSFYYPFSSESSEYDDFVFEI